MNHKAVGPALITLLLAGGAFLVTPKTPWLDDAYITLHSARVVVSGVDPRYHVSALTGSTSPLHVAMTAGLLAIGTPDSLAVHLMMGLGLAAYVLSLWLLGRALGLTPGRHWLFLLVGITAGPIVNVATNGLETGFAMAAVLTALACALRNQPAALAVITGVMPWLRPDLTVIAGALWLFQWRRTPHAWKQLTIIPAVIGIPFAAWVWLDTGHIVPSTIHAKKMFFAQDTFPLGDRWSLLIDGLWKWFRAALPASAGLVLAWRTSVGRAALAAAGLTLAIYLSEYPGAVEQNWYRYTYPLLLPLAMCGVGYMLMRIERRHYLALAALAALAVVPRHVFTYRDLLDEAQELQDLSVFIERDIPATATILVHDAGGPSLRGSQPLIDLVGLKSPSSVAAHERWTWPSGGVQRADAVAAIIRSAHPDYLVMTRGWETSFQMKRAVEMAGYALETVRRPQGVPLEMPAFDAGGHGYTVYRLYPQGDRLTMAGESYK